MLLPDTSPEVPAVPEGVDVVVYRVHDPIPSEHLDAEVLVVWGNTRAQLVDCAERLEHLRWVAVLAAGPDVALSAGFGPQVLVTNGRGLHDVPVTEHTLALILAITRRLDLFARAQQEHRWDDQLLGGIQRPGRFPGLASLRGKRVTVWGFGSIGQTLAPHLAALGADVVGVAREAGERAGFPVIDDDGLPARLAQTDVLVGILPASEQTHHVIGADVFAALPDHAWVVNVGRGATLDEDALVTAIRDGQVAGAALDVAETEPLPADSALWDLPGVWITPHAAGGRPLGVAAFLEANLQAFLAGRPLRNTVPR